MIGRFATILGQVLTVSELVIGVLLPGIFIIIHGNEYRLYNSFLSWFAACDYYQHDHDHEPHHDHD